MVRIKTKKSRSLKPYIIIERFEREVLGMKMNVYLLKFYTSYECKTKLTLKKRKDYIKQNVYEWVDVFGYLTRFRVSSRKINKRSKHIMDEITSEIKDHGRFSYCLNKDILIFAETVSDYDRSYMRDWLSKHIMLCGKGACASGEMVIKNGYFVFDNSSGSFEPGFEEIKVLKKALPFLKMKVVDKHSKERKKYFV